MMGLLPQVNWSRNEIPVVAGGRFVIEHHRLRVQSVQREDSGIYRAVKESANGMLEAVVFDLCILSRGFCK